MTTEDEEEPIHTLMTFPSRAAVLAAAKFSTSWIIITEADAERALKPPDGDVASV